MKPLVLALLLSLSLANQSIAMDRPEDLGALKHLCQAYAQAMSHESRASALEEINDFVRDSYKL